MKLQVRKVEFYRLEMRTRFPFRYGIANLTRLPHLFVRVEVDIDGKMAAGVSADGLVPKWFTKNSDTTFEEDDLPAMQQVIRKAADLALQQETGASVYAWWRTLYESQHHWANEHDIPALLAGFGVSLLERAVIDAACRSSGLTFFDALRSGFLGIECANELPASPRETVFVRHTVGMSDPLTDQEIDVSEQVSDGLPHSLQACVRRYGLKYFKVKLSGRIQDDTDRLKQIAGILANDVGPEMRFTLDGNEQFADINSFYQAWQSFRSDPDIRQMFDQSLLFVEQPLNRDRALSEDVKDALSDWPDAPPMIIDESDATLDSLTTALECGYSGTSHKNCKGVFKSVAAATTIRGQRDSGRQLILSAEDLVNVGPVALLQDLAVVAALGIDHVERNGHHYIAGLSMHPFSTQQQAVDDHGDLYQWHGNQFAAVAPAEGQLALGSINESPFGVRHLPDFSQYERWAF